MGSYVGLLGSCLCHNSRVVEECSFGKASEHDFGTCLVTCSVEELRRTFAVHAVSCPAKA